MIKRFTSTARPASHFVVEKDIDLGRPTGVVWVRINRPSTLNALTVAMGREFASIMGDIGHSPHTKAIILTGMGKGFSAGGDLEWLRERTRTSPAENATIMRDFYSSFIIPLLSVPCPTIAALNGVAVGAGAALSLGADIRLASTKAKMGFNFVKLGIPPGMASSYLLPKLIGHGNAAKVLLSGTLFDAQQAEALGIVQECIPHDELDSKALALGREIASGSQAALNATVKTLRLHYSDASMDRALQREADTQAICFASPDIQEGLRAVAEKRSPTFKV
ncbi:hypothetical protein HDU91_001109 [Kappamyces sp. JEL0680]|nr:hypothetical protein HDU91_001109 [Kappamyces sp. JEL0680]